jgi:hypothetical protein
MNSGKARLAAAAIAAMLAAPLAAQAAPAAAGAEADALAQERAAVDDEADAELLAKMMWGEARGVESDTEKAACAWAALNRVDSPGYPDTVGGVVKAKGQFLGYSESNPADSGLLALALDVLARWRAEKERPGEPSGRVLPAGYLWFAGDGERNWFRDRYKGGERWDWALPSPYES